MSAEAGVGSLRAGATDASFELAWLRVTLAAAASFAFAFASSKRAFVAGGLPAASARLALAEPLLEAASAGASSHGANAGGALATVVAGVTLGAATASP